MRHVGCEVDLQGRGKQWFHFLDCPLDLVRDPHDIFAAPFQNRQGDTLVAVEAAAGQGIFKAVLDLRHISEVDRLAVTHKSDDGENLRRIFEVLGYPDQVLGLSDVHAPAWHVDVAAGDGTDKAGEGDVIGAYPVKVEFHVDFPFKAPGESGIQDARDGFYPVFQVFCEFLEPAEAERSGKDHADHRQIREIDFLNYRLIREVGRQIILGLIHFVSNLLNRIVDIHAGQKLHGYGAQPFRGRGAYLLYIRDALEFSFDGNRDELFHVLGRDTLVCGGDKDIRDGDVGERFTWQCGITVHTGHHD